MAFYSAIVRPPGATAPRRVRDVEQRGRELLMESGNYRCRVNVHMLVLYQAANETA